MAQLMTYEKIIQSFDEAEKAKKLAMILDPALSAQSPATSLALKGYQFGKRQQDFFSFRDNVTALKNAYTAYKFDVWKHGAAAALIGCRPQYLSGTGNQMFKPAAMALNYDGQSYVTLVPEHSIAAIIVLYSVMNASEKTYTKMKLNDIIKDMKSTQYEIDDAISALALL